MPGDEKSSALLAILEKLETVIKFIRGFARAAIVAPASASAQHFELGLSAAQTGDYAKALLELQPLAEQGHAPQQVLGAMYCACLGEAQNHAEACNDVTPPPRRGLPIARFI